MITLQVFSYLTGVADMNPEVEKLISQVIDEVHRKSVHEARLDAREKGWKEGREEGREEVAKNLRGVIADEEISRVSGLSLERVKQL